MPAPSSTPVKEKNKGRVSDIWHFRKAISIAGVFSAIGAFIIAHGVFILVAINWDEMSDGVKIFSTLGVSIILYAAGVFCFKYDKLQLNYIGYVFHAIVAVVMPFGMFVLIAISNTDVNSASPWVHALIAGITFFVNTASYFLLRKNVFILFSILCGSWLFFALTSWIGDASFMSNTDMLPYEILIFGITHLLLGVAFAHNDKRIFTILLYLFGVASCLISMVVVDSDTPLSSGFFIFATLFLALLQWLYYHLFQKISFLFFTILSATGVFFACIYLIIPDPDATSVSRQFVWALSFFLAGIVYMALGRVFAVHKTEKNQPLWRQHFSLSTTLYFLGSVALLGGGFALNDTQGKDGNFIWEVLYPVFVIGCIGLSVYLQSKVTLVASFIALVSYIILITTYFADDNSFSWPVALIVLGFLFIGIGYIPFYLKRKFFIIRKDS